PQPQQLAATVGALQNTLGTALPPTAQQILANNGAPQLPAFPHHHHRHCHRLRPNAWQQALQQQQQQQQQQQLQQQPQPQQPGALPFASPQGCFANLQALPTQAPQSLPNLMNACAGAQDPLQTAAGLMQSQDPNQTLQLMTMLIGLLFQILQS